MYREKEAFEKLGAQVVVIGHSSLRYAQAFVEETKIDLPVYVDEKRVVYQALEFKRPLLSFLTPKVFKRAARPAGTASLSPASTATPSSWVACCCVCPMARCPTST